MTQCTGLLHVSHFLPALRAMSLTLSPAEIFELTGRVQPAAQLRRLRAMGIRAYRIDNPERPICVCREWLTARPAPSPTVAPRLKSDVHAEAA